MSGAKKLSRCVAVALLMAGAVLIVGALRQQRGALISDAALATVAREIMSVGEIYRGPEVSHSGAELAYARSTNGGRRLFRVDLGTGKQECLPHVNEVLRVYGYSPDDRYLLLKDLDGWVERFMLFDRQTCSFRTAAVPTTVTEVVWLRTNVLAFAQKAGKETAVTLVTVADGEQKARTLRKSGTILRMVPLSEREVGFVEAGNLWALDVETGETRQLSRLTEADLDPERSRHKLNVSDFEWVNYSGENHEFLFCSWVKFNWRHLYRYGPVNGGQGKAVALTEGEDHCIMDSGFSKEKVSRISATARTTFILPCARNAPRSIRICSWAGTLTPSR